MSNTKREPLLSDEEIERYSMMYTIPSRYETARALKYAKGIYEAARAKDAELIQQLVDDLRILRIEFGNRVGQTTQIGIASLSAAEAAGFKPSDPSN